MYIVQGPGEHLGLTSMWSLCAGVFMAMQTLQQRSHAAVRNLRTLNPYVANALSDWGYKGCSMPASLPRMVAPACTWQAHALAGASSFGMGGTNAHLLSGVPEPRQDGRAAAHAWQRSRCAVPDACDTDHGHWPEDSWRADAYTESYGGKSNINHSFCIWVCC